MRLEMVLQIHLSVECNPDDFELALRPNILHAKLNFEQSADLGEVVELEADALT